MLFEQLFIWQLTEQSYIYKKKNKKKRIGIDTKIKAIKIKNIIWEWKIKDEW